ncbi:MAG TPA: gas vesicle protein K [Acidimicrobiales bacterium]|nr:gas vesicle protein K [Acidimicrobiales bacterium]
MPDAASRLLWQAGDLPAARMPAPRGRIEADPEKVERGLAQLVLTVVELLRQLMERQAIRRMDGGSLTEDQEEKIGLGLMRLAEKMDDLKAQFGLEDDDLNIHLGPLGDLL